MVWIMTEVANRYASVYEEHLGVPRDTEVIKFVISEVSQMISMIQPLAFKNTAMMIADENTQVYIPQPQVHSRW